MKKFFGFLAMLGTIVAVSAEAGCVTIILDEPEAPKSLM